MSAMRLVGVERRAARASCRRSASIVLVATKRPWVWKIGSAWISTSSSVKRQSLGQRPGVREQVAWVSIAPFERPVVPEV